MRRLPELLKRFHRDERGAFLVIFAVIALVLIATSGAVVDFTYMQTARSRAQNALDAAALALQARISLDDVATLKAKSVSIMNERLADSAIVAKVNSATPDTANGKLTLQAQITVPTAFIQLIGIKSITAQLTSQATKGSKNLEVSASLDITGSMAGTKIADLISATNTLIDLVVKDTQTPTYSKMAIVPWAFAVNLGSWANNVRGTPTAGTAITAASWTMGSSITISGITRANPGVVTTASPHGFSNGDTVYFSGVKGMTNVNGKTFTIANVSSTSFTLGTNTSGWSAFKYGKGSGKVVKCATPNCEVVVTSFNHGLANGEVALITGVNGMTNLNNLWTVASKTTNTFVAAGSYGPSYPAYANGGTTYCTRYGCMYEYFANAAGGANLYQVNNCATERAANAYDDTAPSTSYLGFDYTSGGAECVNQVVQPLTTDKTTLHALANSLTATGSTAGHLGLAWGWYMISPNFGYLWPTASQPATYTATNLIKAVILMTDGDFNSAYCNGVIAADSGSGSGSSSTHINCNATNGPSLSQAGTLCTNIKTKQNTTLYTVGFDLGSNTSALNFLQSCASSPSDFFRADTGTDLSNAFKSIAQNLNSLRLSE